MPFYYVEITDNRNGKVKLRIDNSDPHFDPTWKSLTVGKFRVPVGISQDWGDSGEDLRLYYDDTYRYGYQKLGQFAVAVLHDFWLVKNRRINDMGNAFLEDGAIGMAYGMAMWKQVPQ